jgi:prepilin-type N-terminal cleavage/methylation domain-containing protein/prepilin-type processing-associated H-X9-DG protein
MRDKGFTLIELLLVIAILITVASLIIPVMFGVRRKALVISCQSNLRQTEIFLNAYSIENDGFIPRTIQDVEARNDPSQLKEPSTGIPSLKGLISGMKGAGADRLKILRCPSDKGSFGQGYYPTPLGATCWKYFGQSFQVNVEMYVDASLKCPGYNPRFDGPMYGANAVKRDACKDASKYLMLGDMWSHWHNEIAVNGESRDYYVNMMFFDGHVGGKSFNSSLESRQYLDMNSVKRWWEPPEPEAM